MVRALKLTLLHIAIGTTVTGPLLILGFIALVLLVGPDDLAPLDTDAVRRQDLGRQ
jgi:hypothetical protein